MNKKVIMILTLIAMLLIGASIVAAQGNGKGGNGNSGNGGNGNQTQVCDPAVQDCTVDQQQQQNGNGNRYGQNGGNSNAGNGGNGNQTQICDPAVEDCSAQQQNGNGGYGTGMNGAGMYADLPDAYAGELPQEIIDLMIEGWLDEQNAYAIYDAVIAQFGQVAPFVSIQNAEAQHAAAWEFLFDRYGITAPEITIGFTPEFATLEDACRAAADAENANFELYDTMLDSFEAYPDIAQIATALRNASENYHLPAFESCAN